MSAPTAIEIIAEESAAIGRINRSISDGIAEKNRLKSEMTAGIQRLAELQALDDRDEGVRLLEGDDAAVPVDKVRRREIESLGKRTRAIAAALPLLDERIAKMRTELSEHEPPRVAAAINLIDSIQEPAVQAFTVGLATLSDHLVQLLAAGLVHQHLLGSSYILPDGSSPPFGARAVVETFLKGLPARLRPPELETEHLFATAQEAADAILCQIGKDS